MNEVPNGVSNEHSCSHRIFLRFLLFAGHSGGGGGVGTERHGTRAPVPFTTRFATRVCQLRHERMEQGLTEPHSARGTFLLSSGDARGGRY